MSGNVNLMDQSWKHALHAVIVPFPAQGHVNALMNLAHLLVIRGVFVTFVNTEWIQRRIVEASKKPKSLASKDELELEKQGPRIRFLSIPDGLPPNHGRTANPPELGLSLQKLGPILENALKTADEKSPSCPPITFIVTDSVMSCTEEVASNMKVPRVIFWPLCAAASIAQSYAHFLVSEGHIPVNVSEGDNPEKLITCLPGNIPPLKPTDLNSLFRVQDTSDICYNCLLYESQKQSKGDYVLVNTFEELEGRDAVAALSLNGCPALAIGPLFLPNFLEGRDSCTSLWQEEEESCLRWLDMQQPGSVIYVSFGSLAVKSILPEGFEERTKERALFVGWVPQSKVLAHVSVGLFVTHNGWNSMLETMSMGVPVVGFPYFGEQFLNSRFAKDVWKIGLAFEDVEADDQKVVMKEEVEDVIRRMMKTPEGKKLRDNVRIMKESATKAVLPGGSSFLNLNTFVNDLTMGKGVQSKNETM